MTTFQIEKITADDKAYPASLHTLHDAPKEIYARGNLSCLALPTVALVGTRHPSEHGATVARQFAAAFARAGLCVVSGLAYGIDAMAHLGALDGHGATVAVLGSGADDTSIYPTGNRGIARKILEGKGLIIAENPPGTKPQTWDFPKRNRIIAALSSVTIVVEAPEKSGALITAKYALELGRDVYVVPADTTRETAAGSNKLIGFGAPVLLTPDEIIETLGEDKGGTLFDATANQPHNQNEAAILHTLTGGPLHVDDVTEATQLPAHVVLATLTALELRGVIQSLGNMRFVLTLNH